MAYKYKYVLRHRYFARDGARTNMRKPSWVCFETVTKLDNTADRCTVVASYAWWSQVDEVVVSICTRRYIWVGRYICTRTDIFTRIYICARFAINFTGLYNIFWHWNIMCICSSPVGHPHFCCFFKSIFLVIFFVYIILKRDLFNNAP